MIFKSSMSSVAKIHRSQVHKRVNFQAIDFKQFYFAPVVFSFK